VDERLPHDLLEEWLEGSLTEAQAAEFETHLLSCEECRAEAARARTLIRLAAAVPAPPVPEGIREGIRLRVARRRAPRLLRPVGVLAVVALAASLLLIVLPTTPRLPPAPQAPILAAATATVLFDWLDQARHATAADAARLIEEARAMELREALRRKLETAPARDREGWLAFEDLLTQFMAAPSADSLSDEAQLVAGMVRR
jgi:predicted anti-sigma-YlaC factor YlaD